MEGVLQVELPPSKRKKKNSDYNLCILCQKSNNQDLIDVSSCSDKLLEAFRKRQQLGFTSFIP